MSRKCLGSVEDVTGKCPPRRPVRVTLKLTRVPRSSGPRPPLLVLQGGRILLDSSLDECCLPRDALFRVAGGLAHPSPRVLVILLELLRLTRPR